MKLMLISVTTLALVGCAAAAEDDVLFTRKPVDAGTSIDTATPSAPPDTGSMIDTSTPPTSCSGKPGTTCKPGDTRSAPCGRCGTVKDTCDPITCTWSPGTCSGEGACEPGATETIACTGADETKSRTCEATCNWSSFSACAVPSGWKPIAAPPTGFEGRVWASTIWSGSEMIVFGGRGTNYKKDGAAFKLSTNTWRTLAPAPDIFAKGRYQHVSVWTGSKMVVWGGLDGTGYYAADGATYDPIADAWKTIAPSPLSARAGMSAVWSTTTHELLVWGGAGCAAGCSDGAAYDPATDKWSALPASPLAGRSGQSVVWSGSEMIVWGGSNGGVVGFPDAASYDPKTKAWTKLPAPPASLSPRFDHVALFSGKEMIVWGGYGGVDIDDLTKKTGARYTPGGTWVAMSIPDDTVLSPTARRHGPFAWFGAGKMYVWSGGTSSMPSAVTGGATYDPSTDTWKAMPSKDAPAARIDGSVIWTGKEAIVWGGAGTRNVMTSLMTDGAVFRP